MLCDRVTIQRGFILVPVLVVVTLVTSMAMILMRQSALDTKASLDFWQSIKLEQCEQAASLNSPN